jgi:hypothetical protein
VRMLVIEILEKKLEPVSSSKVPSKD